MHPSQLKTDSREAHRRLGKQHKRPIRSHQPLSSSESSVPNSFYGVLLMRTCPSLRIIPLLSRRSIDDARDESELRPNFGRAVRRNWLSAFAPEYGPK